MAHQPAYPDPCKTPQTWLHILEILVINKRSCGIRKLPGICLMVAEVHYFVMLMLCVHLYKLIWCIEKTVLMFLMYRGCIHLCLQISIAASYLLCIMYFSVTSLGHSLMMYGTSDENNSYLIETVSNLMPINCQYTNANKLSVHYR